jgi:flagellar biosynthesis GTPase FlhF
MKKPSPGPPYARTPARTLEQFDRAFEEEMDVILIQPNWFEKREEHFKEEIPEGAQFEDLVRRAMDRLHGRVVPQLIGQWLFVLGNACKNARLKRMRNWEQLVEAYHVLIAKLVMSDAYAIFTNTLMEDRIYLEGLALWAGHDYSSTKGRNISHWTDEYRRLIMRKSWPMRTYLQWSTSVHRVLHGERALGELAQISVYSTKCMGKEKVLYVPEAMEQRIQRAGGLNGLIRCDEHANRLEPREFTAFLAKAIETRKNPWPSQKEVQDGTAPMQIIQEFKAWQRQRGLQSPPPRGFSPLSPRVKWEPKTETGPATPKGSYKEILKRSDNQAPITQFMSPKKRASEVERVITEGEERLEALEPVLQDIKQEVQKGAAGRRLLKQGAEDVEMSETETDEEPLQRERSGAKRKTVPMEEKPSKRQETETEEEAPAPKNKKDKKKKKKKAREEKAGAEEDRSRKLLEARKPADLKTSRLRSIEVLRKMQREEESVRRRRLERSARFLDYINKHPDQFPVVERTTKGKAVPVEGKELDRLYEQGCEVIVILDPDEPRAKYGFLMFLELDLIVGSELGPLPTNAIYGGQLFMPHDLPTAFGPCKTEKRGVEEPQTALIIEEVVNMALRSEVDEHRHQRNRAMLASWGGFNS